MAPTRCHEIAGIQFSSTLRLLNEMGMGLFLELYFKTLS
jgi:hypothetical protein